MPAVTCEKSRSYPSVDAAIAVADVEVDVAGTDADAESGLDHGARDAFARERQVRVAELEVVEDGSRHITEVRLDDRALEIDGADAGPHIRAD